MKSTFGSDLLGGIFLLVLFLVVACGYSVAVGA